MLDAVIDALAREGLVVVLDNHTSDAMWCCSTSDGNGLWYTSAYPEASWLADWRGMAARYASVPAVIGADLRNELRAADGVTPTWGGSAATDWRAAATRAGNAILAIAPSWLVFVEGLSFSNDLTGAYGSPIVLDTAGRVVYSPHDYAMDHPALVDARQLDTALGDSWGFLLEQGKAFTAPVWVGELGTCHTDAACIDGATGQGLWFASLRAYLANADIDWSYWAVNGTESTGATRTLGAEETYGLFDTSWTAPASPLLVDALAAIQPRTQGP